MMSYAAHSDIPNRNVADIVRLNEFDSISDPTARERTEHVMIKPIISTKEEFGLGVESVNFWKQALKRWRMKCLRR
jgi:hypothetical protein